MLHAIRRKHAAARDRDAVGLLLDCHDRMRVFASIAERLSTALDAPEADVAAAARRVRRYFALALPRHEEDEELSIAPRLLSSNRWDDVAAALSQMSREHARVHEILAALEARWDVLVDAPRELAALSPVLSGPSAELRALLAEHLAMEEGVIFPVVRQLDDVTLGDILAEMRARREVEPWTD